MFEVSMAVRGTVRITVEAKNKADAEAKAQAELYHTHEVERHTLEADHVKDVEEVAS